MKNESESTAQSPDEIIAQIARLMAEAEAMLVAPGAAVGAEGPVCALRDRFDELKASLAGVGGEVRRKLVRGVELADEKIRSHPYEAVAIALGVGVLLGTFLHRERD